jgi:hypothetical protein
MVFLDANPVIYLIEQPANLGSKVTARVSDLLASGERLAVSDWKSSTTPCAAIPTRLRSGMPG